MTVLDQIVARTLPLVPRPVVRRFSRRYIAGDSLADAARVVRDLNAQGFLATLDVLGETVESPGLVERAVQDYLAALRAIGEQRLQANISIKLTQLGLKIDVDLCRASLRTIVQAARDLGNFVRIDMEDSSCTGATLDLHRALRSDGFENVGVVLQAYMRRSLADVRALPPGSNVRLCKGIYIEPRSVAYQGRSLVRKNYLRLLEELLDRGVYVGIATHDEDLVWESLRILESRRAAADRYEFQMLLGVDEELRRMVLAEGHRLRVYVPFGVHWYAYSLRRLKENPRIAGYVVLNLLSRRPA